MCPGKPHVSTPSPVSPPPELEPLTERGRTRAHSCCSAPFSTLRLRTRVGTRHRELLFPCPSSAVRSYPVGRRVCPVASANVTPTRILTLGTPSCRGGRRGSWQGAHAERRVLMTGFACMRHAECLLRERVHTAYRHSPRDGRHEEGGPPRLRAQSGPIQGHRLLPFVQIRQKGPSPDTSRARPLYMALLARDVPEDRSSRAEAQCMVHCGVTPVLQLLSSTPGSHLLVSVTGGLRAERS